MAIPMASSRSLKHKRKSLLDLCKLHELEHASSCPNMGSMRGWVSSLDDESIHRERWPLSPKNSAMRTTLPMANSLASPRTMHQSLTDLQSTSENLHLERQASQGRPATQMREEDLELLEVLGQGGYATTYRARIVNGVYTPPSSAQCLGNTLDSEGSPSLRRGEDAVAVQPPRGRRRATWCV
jgi:hypothetical protein